MSREDKISLAQRFKDDATGRVKCNNKIYFFAGPGKQTGMERSVKSVNQ